MQLLDRNLLVRLRPRPGTLYVSQGRTVFSMGEDGFIAENSSHGLFCHQTRLLSRYRWFINDKPWQPLALSNLYQHSWLGYYIALPPEITGYEIDMGSGQMEEVSEQTVEMRISRHVGQGVHEDVDLTNFAQRPTSFRLRLDIDADFADQEEFHIGRRQFGELQQGWEQTDSAWLRWFDYVAEHYFQVQGNEGTRKIHRGLRAEFRKCSTDPSFREGIVEFEVTLLPRATWHACIHYIPFIDGKWLLPQDECASVFTYNTPTDKRRMLFLNETVSFSAFQAGLGDVVSATLERAKEDLATLRLHDLDHGERIWTMAAGSPIYLALFGRDTLTASWQSAILGPEMMQGTLAELARWQGTEDNPWRDEQPGKMLHEAHDGPLARLGFNPRDRYYGAITTSAFYPVVVAELWHWTGDRELVLPLLEPAIRALQWLDRYSDLTGDGFYDYKSRSVQGNRNQAWKDSADAIVYEDGTLVEPPIATCEEQGFAYAAKLFISEVLWWMDRGEEARKFYNDAVELKKRFNDRFWIPEKKFFALALDPAGNRVTSVTSNPGHCIATGIVDASLVRETADRLFQPDMFSGWGVRTLSAEHPAFNPYSYHRGSVWPVEHGSFAIGFMRYGLIQHLHTLCKGMFETAALFEFYRLPETLAGHQRDEHHPFPAIYPKANWPQAWSASATFSMVQALLGLYPYAPLDLLFVDPHLPEWLPEITLSGLRVGKATLTIRFFRTASGGSDYRILEQRGKLHVIRQPSPWSLSANFGERLRDVLLSFTPGR